MTLLDSMLDESHRIFAESCRRFAQREIAPHALKWEEDEHFPRELFNKAGEAGVLGAMLPERYGGGDGDMLHMIVMIEGLLTGGSSGVAASLGAINIATPPILQLGSDLLKARLLPKVATGELVTALAITEPDTGSDVAGVRLRARRDGDTYVLDGSKVFITAGAHADLVTTLARTGDDPHRGLTFFVVERDAPGFSVARKLQKTGWRASDTAELVYEEVRVPAANRLGEEGSGFAALMGNFEGERLLLAAMGHASAEIALAEATRYADEREVFGKPLAGFQVTRHKLAEMETRVVAAKTLNYVVAKQVVAGQRLPREVAMAKNFSAEVARAVCHDAVQIFGGMGYMRETVVERLSRDVRLLSIGGGTHEVMNEIISSRRGAPG